MLFTGKQFKIDMISKLTQPIGDPSEFIRMVTLAEDVLERVKAVDKFKKKFDDVMSEIGKVLN